MKLAVITQIRNESPRLLEWIKYHSSVIGFDHFLFYLDNTTDDSENVLKSLQPYYSIDIKYTNKQGSYADLETVNRRWPNLLPESEKTNESFVPGNIYVEDAHNRSVASFTEGFNLLKFDYDWIAVLDVDEYIVPSDINDFNFKKELSLLNTNVLYIQSFDFRPPFDPTKSITEQEMFRWTSDEQMNSSNRGTGKSIFRGKLCLDRYPRVSVHHGPSQDPIATEYQSIEGGPFQLQNAVTGYKKYIIHHFRSHFYNGGLWSSPTKDQYQKHDDSIRKLFEMYTLNS